MRRGRERYLVLSRLLNAGGVALLLLTGYAARGVLEHDDGDRAEQLLGWGAIAAAHLLLLWLRREVASEIAEDAADPMAR